MDAWPEVLVQRSRYKVEILTERSGIGGVGIGGTPSRVISPHPIGIRDTRR